jgi:hypothetical protein
MSIEKQEGGEFHLNIAKGVFGRDKGFIPSAGILNSFSSSNPAPAAVDPVAAPVAAPIAAPIAAPVAAPVAARVAAPVAAPAMDQDEEVKLFMAARQAKIAAENKKSQGAALIEEGKQLVSDAEVQQTQLVSQGAQIVSDAKAKQAELTTQGTDLINQGNAELNASNADRKALTTGPMFEHGTVLHDTTQGIQDLVGNTNAAITGAVGNAFSSMGSLWSPAEQQKIGGMSREQKNVFDNMSQREQLDYIRGGTRKHKAKKQRKSKKAKKSNKRGSKKYKK